MEDLEALGKSNKLSSLEKPKDILLTTDPFSIENNILTPTFKLKRNVGRDVYKKQIDEMYVELHKKGF
jgi:long-chain acyl-CoA synthetase